MDKIIGGQVGLRSDVVDLFPSGLSGAEGLLLVSGKTYRVQVDRDKGKRVWARVSIASQIANEGRRKAAFDEVARRGASDLAWSLLSVDARDGEMLYSVTHTCDMSPEALDRFLLSAKEFLEQNGEELDRIIGDSADEENDKVKLDKLIDLFDFDFDNL